MSGWCVSIFVRTYLGELKWLRYCLRPIRRDFSGRDAVVVYAPLGQSPSAGQTILSGASD
jgi:hypothetical protein